MPTRSHSVKCPRQKISKAALKPRASILRIIISMQATHISESPPPTHTPCSPYGASSTLSCSLSLISLSVHLPHSLLRKLIKNKGLFHKTHAHSGALAVIGCRSFSNVNLTVICLSTFRGKLTFENLQSSFRICPSETRLMCHGALS